MDLILRMCLAFIKIGAFCFGGGYAAVGLIENEVVKTMGWLTPDQYINIIAIAEMTPGPIAVNTSTFAGYLMSGPIAGILCTLCVIWLLLGLVEYLVGAPHSVLLRKGEEQPKGAGGGKGHSPGCHRHHRGGGHLHREERFS